MIKIHVFHTGRVCVSPYLPFGGDDCSILKASGLFIKKSKRLWLPVSSYLIQHPKGNVLLDCGWSRSMSPDGIYDKKAQIKSIGSRLLYLVNQGVLPKGEAINEQLNAMNIQTSDLDYVLLSHLDCDHANGLELVKDAKKILVASDEVACALKHTIRYRKSWWKDISLTAFDWTGKEGPVEKSYDLFDDGSVVLINIPGHSDGLFAVRVANKEGRFVLLYSDGGYATKSWKEMILPGITVDKAMQRRSLEWIREESLKQTCIESIANHDTDVMPHIWHEDWSRPGSDFMITFKTEYLNK